MRRFAVPLVIVGSAAILVALVVLWRSISSESVASPSPTPASPAATTAPPTQQPPPAPTMGTPSVARPPLPELRGRGEPPGGEPTATERAPPGESGLDPTTDKASPAIQWGIPQMRAQVAANEPKVNECIAQAQARGDKPSGDATLTFIAAKKGDKIVIEETGYDHDGTSLSSDALVECLHGTSKAMTFEGLPRNANAVFVTRTVKIENGALVQNKLVKFSYVH